MCVCLSVIYWTRGLAWLVQQLAVTQKTCATYFLARVAAYGALADGASHANGGGLLYPVRFVLPQQHGEAVA